MQFMSFNAQRGFMAIVLVVFLVVFVAIAASIVSMTTSGSRSAADHVNASRALFMAESGVEWAALELLDSEPDEDFACTKLAGSGGSVGGGTFQVDHSIYVEDEGCDVKIFGFYNNTKRVLEGRIPESVLDGDTGGSDSIFDNEDDWNAAQGQNEIIDGVLYIRQQGSDSSRAQDGADSISDEFLENDIVYFAANVSPDASGLTVTLTFKSGGQDMSCTLGETCSSVDPGNPLLNSYDTVWNLGPASRDKADVNHIVIDVDFGEYSVSEVAIANACIGRQDFCEGQVVSDPVDDGSWNENP